MREKVSIYCVADEDRSSGSSGGAYVDDVKSLVDGLLGAEGETGIDLGGDLAGDDLEDLLAELDEQTVESVVDLGVDIAALALGVLDGVIDQLGVLGLLGGGEDEGGVGGSILRLVLGDGCIRRVSVSSMVECIGWQASVRVGFEASTVAAMDLRRVEETDKRSHLSSGRQKVS